jgi:hypothetical protein
MDGRVIDSNAAFGDHLLKLPQAQVVSQIPPHAEQDHRSVNLLAGLSDGDGCLLVVSLRRTDLICSLTVASSIFSQSAMAAAPFPVARSEMTSASRDERLEEAEHRSSFAAAEQEDRDEQYAASMILPAGSLQRRMILAVISAAPHATDYLEVF